MPIASWRRRCSRMATGKRASMREGPLAALFRKTEDEGLAHEALAAARPPRAPEPPGAAPEPRRREAEPRVPTPQERLRHAFSSDLPDNVMAPPESERPSASDYQWESPASDIARHPQLRVIGVGGGGVNAVNRMIEAEVTGVE